MNTTIRTSHTLVITFFILALAGQDLFAQQSIAYEQGTAAARAGDHQQALSHFQFARDAGDESPNLTWNLGVTHFRLGQYSEAEGYFRQLLDEPQWRDLARYNLGLVAQRRGRQGEANRYFEEVARTAENEKLRALALSRLEPEPVRDPSRAPRPDRGSALYLSLAGGYDSNVIAFPDQLQTDTSEFEDTFIDLVGYGQTYVSGRRDDGVRLFALGSLRRHFDLDFFDTTVLSAGLMREQPFRDWALEYGGAVDHSSLDGDAITTDAQLRLGASRQLGGARMRLTYHPALHSAGSEYSELDGTSHRFDASIRGSGPTRLWAAYRFEYNDRDDRETDIEFFSYSPVRHRLQVGLDNRVGAFSFGLGASHQVSRYRGTNRMSDIDGEFKEARRESNRTDLWLRGGWEFARNLSLTSEFRHTRQTDTFEFFEYDRNLIMLGVEYIR